MNAKLKNRLLDLSFTLVGTVVYALGFDLFLVPNQIGAGGISGLSVVLNYFVPVISIGMFSVLMNIPLFLLGYRFVGRKFFWGSLVGMLASSLFIDLFGFIPSVQTEPLLGAIYGGGLVGAGCGMVFMRGASTGGVDIAGRLLKCKFRNLSIGKLVMMVDSSIAVITGIAFRDVNKALYCFVALYVSSLAVDAVVYSFDYSNVAMIITEHPAEIGEAISRKLERGCTFLNGEGAYTSAPKQVIYCAIKRRQAAELKDLVMELDPNAFMVLQEAHQVLGEGFERYSKNTL